MEIFTVQFLSYLQCQLLNIELDTFFMEDALFNLLYHSCVFLNHAILHELQFFLV